MRLCQPGSMKPPCSCVKLHSWAAVLLGAACQHILPPADVPPAFALTSGTGSLFASACGTPPSIEQKGDGAPTRSRSHPHGCLACQRCACTLGTCPGAPCRCQLVLLQVPSRQVHAQPPGGQGCMVCVARCLLGAHQRSACSATNLSLAVSHTCRSECRCRRPGFYTAPRVHVLMSAGVFAGALQRLTCPAAALW